MKSILLLFSLSLWFNLLAQTNSNHVYVQPYVRSNGTIVKGHYRTAPNNTNRDNFSTSPNINPYTNKLGTIKPDNNYQNTNITNLPSSNSNLELDLANMRLNHLTDRTKFENISLYESKPTYITKSAANLRKNTSANSTILTTISSGEHVKVISSSFEDWWEVYYNGETGYIKSSLLRFVSSGLNRVTIERLCNNNQFRLQYDPYENYPAYYTKGTVNLREHMSTKSAIICVLEKETMVKVINSFSCEWSEVYVDGLNGYVRSDLLTK